MTSSSSSRRSARLSKSLPSAAPGFPPGASSDMQKVPLRALRGGAFCVLRNAPEGKPGAACVLFSDAGVPERRDVRGALLDGALCLLIVAGAVLGSSMGCLAR